MTQRVKAKTWIRNNRGSEADVHELLERVSEQVNTDEPLQRRAREALEALRSFDEMLDAMGWTE
jgi:hypothetical protein